MNTPLRPESSVSLGFNEFGDPVFVCNGSGPVRTRTPEDLGLPRVLPPEAPKRLSIWPKEWPAEPRRMAKRRAERYGEARGVLDGGLDHRKKNASGSASLNAVAPGSSSSEPQAAATVIRGAKVRMPAGAVMGAEMTDLLADAAEKEAGGKVANDFDLSGELNARIVEEIALPAAELAKKYAVPVSRIYGIRGQLRKQGKLPERPQRSLRGGAGPVSARKKPSALARTIDIDAKRNGSAAAVLGALAKHAAEIAIAFSVSQQELARMLAGLDDARRQAFLSAGLKAALLG